MSRKSKLNKETEQVLRDVRKYIIGRDSDGLINTVFDEWRNDFISVDRENLEPDENPLDQFVKATIDQIYGLVRTGKDKTPALDLLDAVDILLGEGYTSPKVEEDLPETE